MNKLFSLLLVAAVLTGSASALMAATGSSTFTVSATVPAPTGVTIAATNITTGATPVYTPVAGTALAFGTLSYDAINGIYIAPHYFSITAGPQAGAGTTSVTVTYTEGANPNNVAGGSGKGLGYKSKATFVKVAGTTETPIAAHGGATGKKLIDVNGLAVSSTDLGGGIFKMYVGVVTDPTGLTGAEVFSGADKPGAYSGTLVVSATVV